MPSNVDFEEGFSFEIPIILKFSKGNEKKSQLIYEATPQKLIVPSKEISK